jgi:hypothetical protein
MKRVSRHLFIYLGKRQACGHNDMQTEFGRRNWQYDVMPAASF